MSRMRNSDKWKQACSRLVSVVLVFIAGCGVGKVGAPAEPGDSVTRDAGHETRPDDSENRQAGGSGGSRSGSRGSAGGASSSMGDAGAASAGGSGGEQSPDRRTPPLLNEGTCESLDLDPIPPCDDSAYYVDAETGDDANAGSNDAPWQSINHARDVAPSGATICVNSGEYGAFEERRPPAISERQVIRAAPDQRPILAKINVEYGSLSDANLTLSGFDVQADVSTGVVVVVHHASGVRLHQLTVANRTWAVEGRRIRGIQIYDSANTIVDRTKVESVAVGVQIARSHDTQLLGNYIVATVGSGIQYLRSNTVGEIAHNHIRGANYTPYPENPDAPDDPHGSIIAFRSGDVVLRGNHMHGMGNSSGIMFYDSGAAAYSDVLIENNVIYDTTNNNAVRFYNLGTNVVLRNNLIFPKKREGDCDNGFLANALYRYNVALVVHEGGTGEQAIWLYNNIFVGMVDVPDEFLVDERNNFAWSWEGGHGWRSTSPSGDSRIVVSEYGGCSAHDPLFENDSFFAQALDPSFPGREAYDFRLATHSPGRDFGDPSVQPSASIGSLDETGFVRADGPCRSSERHNLGPYEVAE